jgi:hypothetical protein
MQNKVNVTTYRKKYRQFQAVFKKPRRSPRGFWVIGPESTELSGPQRPQSNTRVLSVLRANDYNVSQVFKKRYHHIEIENYQPENMMPLSNW